MKKAANTTIVAFLNDILDHKQCDTIKELKTKLVKPEHLTVSQVKMLSSYYSFTFVRNPFDRVLSVYLEKFTKEQINRKYESLPGAGKASQAGFASFVSYLDSGGLYVNRHWWPQVDLLFQPAEDFSFIGKIENMVEDMKKLLIDNNIDPQLAAKLKRPHEKELEKGELRITNAKKRTSQFYTKKEVETVVRLYKRDFESFGYSVTPEWFAVDD